jgi:transcriptional regulator with XRE-family HTH domain
MTTKKARQPTFRDRRIALRKSIRDLEGETGINRGRLSVIERGVLPSLAEHELIERALTGWEAVA